MPYRSESDLVVVRQPYVRCPHGKDLRALRATPLDEGFLLRGEYPCAVCRDLVVMRLRELPARALAGTRPIPVRGPAPPRGGC